jgi:hypothetical protein
LIRLRLMTRTSLLVLVLTIAVCLATQCLPLFPFGGPPPNSGVINFYGWPCLTLTTVANADAAGQVYEQRDFHAIGFAVNAVVLLASGFCCFAGVAWFLIPSFPRFSILDLLAFTTSVAVIIAYFLLTPRYGLPLATLSDSASTYTYFTTDRPLFQNALCSLLIVLAIFGCISLAGSLRRHNTPVQG